MWPALPKVEQMTDNKREGGAGLSPIEDVIADAAAGKLFILVDDEDRENEGDLCVVGEWATAEAINFMAKYGRGLICLALTRSRTEALGLSLMERRNESRHQTAFTVSIEAREGVTTGISAADRAHTVRTAINPQCNAKDITTPGHIFPLVARDGGTLVRAGHTEAVVDIARATGVADPSGVICEIMKDDGTMARLPDLELFAAEHGLKIGTIADLIEYRSRHESLITRAGRRRLNTAQGEFDCQVFTDRTGATHLALSHGAWAADDEVLVRVHEPLSLMDLLEAGPCGHSWPLPAALAALKASSAGVAVLLNCGDHAAGLLARAQSDRPVQPSRGAMDLRTYGVGAQILKDLGVHRMKLLGSPRRMPSMTGFGLEVTGFVAPPSC